ncbi:hypothetical protein HF329_04520 [Chitinophaga oryzae]|uniref:MACPF domain-containing protein n=1 Tax=Chitinophaga oryzae TaxID=2725414 RepID=A0AAE7D5U8_9BACT|nr:MAC/perforin domain-containing protein [Chitinophaga oryzae]QJB30600.1 hypothetical protein HF329_04520 [Chitinophaga oryzae]
MNKKQLAMLPAIALLGSLLTSCSKQFTQNDQLQPEALNGVSVTELRSFADPQFNLLGFGYDLTGNYASATSATYQIIDVARLNAEQPGRVEIIQTQGQDQQLVSGINCEDYTKSLSLRLEVTAKLKMFSTTLKSAFSDSSAYSSKFVYSSYNVLIKQRTLKFAADTSLLRKYLTPAFKADIVASTPAALVSRYGTHVMSGILLGAKLNFLYQSQTRNEDRFRAASAGLNVAAGSIFSVNVQGAASSSYSSKNFYQRLYYQTVGGDPTKGLFGTIVLSDNPNQTVPKIDVSAWQSSATLANSELVDINFNGLIPIYDLISDPVKRTAVKDYVTQYLIDHQVKTSTDPVHVYYHYGGNNHTMTIDPTNYDYAGNGWTYLGNNFHAFTSQVEGSQAVHEFYHPTNHNHVFTINRFDWPYEQNGFQYFGPAFYAFTTQVAGSLPVHAFYHQGNNDHTYTINRYDYPYEQNGWTYLGVAFYAFKTPYIR